ncbi:MAG: 50S ribosomal protein L29 [Gammaproteobacteria bacterium]|nr:50S ribosomal protein L29 [Gammaproteobacteria bacterium]
MKATEMKQKKPAELKQLLTELLQEQFKLRMQRGSGQLSRPSRLKAVRREIARVRTLLNQQGDVVA